MSIVTHCVHHIQVIYFYIIIIHDISLWSLIQIAKTRGFDTVCPLRLKSAAHTYPEKQTKQKNKTSPPCNPTHTAYLLHFL